MRLIALLLLIALNACAAGTPEEPAFIADFASRSTPTRCEPVPSLTARRSMVRDLVTISDSSVLILYDQDHEVAIVGPDLEIRHLVTIPAEGPTGVAMPSGAALLGDSLLYIADQTGMKLKVLDLQGHERETIPLDFAPQSLQQLGHQLLITPFVIGNHPRSLVYTLEGGRARALPIATARYSDGLVNTFANTAHLAPYPDGRIVLTHTLIIPFARVLTPESSTPARVPLPLPDGVRERYGWLPNSPVTEANAEKLLFATIASAPDESTGDLIYLTKTGRVNADGGEKALIRVDSKLRFLRSYLLGVNATNMAYLSKQGISLVVTPEDEWYSCPTP
jgi:hypothetical protein